ncbi:hypothetical protein EW15_0537 [Prochlorococcus sp. MIT 0801]|nr:hypothetical protein EW15_0537 [Prochlorococcus sp. MIT 0801]
MIIFFARSQRNGRSVKNYFVHNDQAKHMARMFNLALEVGNEEISKNYSLPRAFRQ